MKYGNKRCEMDGIAFDSMRERSRYRELRLLEMAGEIFNLELQPVFVLAPAVTLDGRRRPPLRFTADFAYTENAVRVVEDVKSPATAAETAYRMRRHLAKSVLGIEVREVS